MPTTLIEAPASTPSLDITTLAYLDAYDAILNDDYAFVAYKETERDSGAWRVRIRSRHTAGAVFEPEMMRTHARAAAARGEPYFVWGFQMDPSAGDPRQIHFRVHQTDGKPASIEMFVQFRRADGSADQARSVFFPWPA